MSKSEDIPQLRIFRLEGRYLRSVLFKIMKVSVDRRKFFQSIY